MKKASSPSPVRKKQRYFILTVVPILAALHVYIGWQLLPSLPIGNFGLIIGIFLLVLSTALIPLSMLARYIFQPQSTADKVSFAGSLAMGFFSSLLLLTLIRSVLLVTMNSANEEESIPLPLA